ncbi:hypothetical protein M433DRAFT_7279 [Acidomyces richmondensis BFW]|nr:hypothetical protein M433DRAFT_7279 [Acidomyces richmondensis BFW]
MDGSFETEKSTGVTELPTGHINRYGSVEGDLQVLNIFDLDEVKLAKDGKTVLIRQPSDAPNDPLCWPETKKNLALASLVMIINIPPQLTDFGMAWGSVIFEDQAVKFKMSISAVANSIPGGLFPQGPGGVLAVPFYFHERTRRLNFWVFCLFGGPCLGPFLASWLIQIVNWRTDFGVLAAFHGVSTLIVVIFGDETLYDRENPQSKPTGAFGRIKLLTGFHGDKAQGRPTIWRLCKDITAFQLKPQIFFHTVVFVIVLVAWVIGINTTITKLILPPPYTFSRSAAAASWLAPMIGALISEIWGHWFDEWLQHRYIT